jgi:hypothetical protein
MTMSNRPRTVAEQMPEFWGSPSRARGPEREKKANRDQPG